MADASSSLPASTPASAASKEFRTCPICLESIEREAYLDSCFHTFCYRCITNWSKYIALKQKAPPSSIKCPLCKGENLSIIHGISGVFFQRHYVNQPQESSFLTEAHKFRLLCYEIEPGMMRSKFCPSLFWKNRGYLQQNRFLKAWLMREIQALLQEEDVDVIMYHILGVIESFFKRQPKGQHYQSPYEDKQREFQKLVSDAARPFLSGRTDRFIGELEIFMASRLTLEAYDAACMNHLRMPSSTAVSSNDSSEEE